jgi:hypothetical protein
LLCKLNKENALNLARFWAPRSFQDSSEKSQNGAKRRTNPAISALQSSNAGREIDFLAS